MDNFFFKDIGDYLAKNWAYTDRKSIPDICKELSADGRMICLLASLVAGQEKLQDYVFGIDWKLQLQNEEKRQVRAASPVANALLEIYRRSAGEVRIQPSDIKMLSARARKAVIRCGFIYFSDISKEKLMETRNCGAATTAEVLEWCEKILGR